MKYPYVLMAILFLAGTFASHADTVITKTPSLNESKMMVKMNINGQQFVVRLQDNPTTKAWVDTLPLQLEMVELNGNEKFADLPHALPSRPVRPGTIQAGDLMLYGTQTLVLFYESFESSYSYTHLGKVLKPENLSVISGQKKIWVEFSDH
ncbi:cyclophilin-like fold protein [Serratia proteamaculans]|uniref:cyclophilin-like fold protein n=1 Tax=Serratia proteamaculans TaxID=28151 RepID=UPI003CEDDE31